MPNSNNFLYVQVFLLNNYKKDYAFRGYAQSVSTISSEGKMDILPTHANYFGLVKDKLNIIAQDGKALEINITKGVIETSNNWVNIFVEF